jgi:hypothetical protein
VVLILTVTFTSATFADAAPKPSLDITIENIDGASCLVDLLILEDIETDNSPVEAPWFLDESDMQAQYDLIKSYSEGGYRQAMATGFNPISGTAFTKIEDGRASVGFGYRVPTAFKVIAVSDTGQVYVSEAIQKRAFNASMTFNAETGQIKESSNLGLFAVIFSMTFVITVIIEELVLVIFGMRSKRNFKVVFYVNVLTQVLLAVAVFSTSYFLGALLAIIMLLLMEVIIFIIEVILFIIKLDHPSKLRKGGFALVANLASLILGTAIVGLIAS